MFDSLTVVSLLEEFTATTKVQVDQTVLSLENKLVEIHSFLVCWFGKKWPRQSRVVIFSNV
jgi:hypothetical protein